MQTEKTEFQIFKDNVINFISENYDFFSEKSAVDLLDFNDYNNYNELGKTIEDYILNHWCDELEDTHIKLLELVCSIKSIKKSMFRFLNDYCLASFLLYDNNNDLLKKSLLYYNEENKNLYYKLDFDFDKKNLYQIKNSLTKYIENNDEN